MFLIFILSFVLTANPAALAEIKGRITSGNNATEGQFPYQVGLLLNGTNPNIDWCGGCLIGREWVLTAAHCLKGVRSATVFLGSTVRLQAEDTRYVSKENFIIHSGYNSATFRDDIALIKIPSATLSKKVQIVKIPSILNITHSRYENEFAIASGWGKISDKEPFVARHLRWARLQIISNEVCKVAFDFVTDSSMCVATPDLMSPCYGDSGGPLVLESDGTLVGGFSFLALKGCEKGYPVAYIRLTNYLDWIYYNTGIFY